MTGRRRLKLVPSDCVECFEVRVALYFDAHGKSQVAVDISTPDDPEPEITLHEVLGALEMAKDIINEQYTVED